MNTLVSWVVVLWQMMRYFAYRAGWISQPYWLPVRKYFMNAIGCFLGWDRRFRIAHPERCPTHGPVIFACNHIRGEDPYHVFHAIFAVTRGAVQTRFMMREGILDGTRLKSKYFDGDEINCMLGAILISRDKVQLSQMKPFINLLIENESFLIFPGRTRSRSGMVFEYRDNVLEPGGVSFFIAQAQRKRPETSVPVVPIGIAYNPASKRATVQFGEPNFLVQNASRVEQRAFDFNLAVAMSDLLEINMMHLVSLVIYLRCLHLNGAEISLTDLQQQTTEIAGRIQTHAVYPGVLQQPVQELRRAVKYLKKYGMLTVDGNRLIINRAAILDAPSYDAEFKRKNPVKYFVNHMLHFTDVIAAAEEIVLR